MPARSHAPKHLTGSPTHSIASIDINCRYAASRLSLIFKPCLYSSRPRPCSCESRTKLFLPHPPSLNAACAARSGPSRVAPPLRIPVLTAYVSMGSRRSSPIAIDFVGAPQFSQPYALPDRPLFVVFVCLSEPYRSNFVVPTRFRDLCALIENRVRSAGAHIGHCPSQRKSPNVGTLS